MLETGFRDGRGGGKHHLPELSLNSGKVKGDLVCSGSARVAESGEIEGAVTAQELALGGTLKGNARIEALTHLFSAKAYMQGDLPPGGWAWRRARG